MTVCQIICMVLGMFVVSSYLIGWVIEFIIFDKRENERKKYIKKK